MSVQLVGQWLQDYGVEEFSGACTFTYRDSIEFGLEVSTDESHLVLHSVVGRVPESDQAESLRRLLQMNHLGIETQGATISLDESGENIVLWISLPIDRLDPDEFERVVGAFLDLSDRVAGEL